MISSAAPGPRYVATRVMGLAGALSLGIASVAAAQTAIPPSAPDFAMSAAQSDQYEIVAAQDALAQSQNPRIKAFAQEMIDAHMRTTEALKAAVTASGMMPPPPAMSSDQASMVSAIQSLRGADFDKAYARQQVLAHTQALAVEQSYANAGKDANLRKAAQAAVPVIQHHLQMAQDLSAVVGAS